MFSTLTFTIFPAINLVHSLFYRRQEEQSYVIILPFWIGIRVSYAVILSIFEKYQREISLQMFPCCSIRYFYSLVKVQSAHTHMQKKTDELKFKITDILKVKKHI